MTMKIKNYTNVFAQAQEHPQAQQFYNDAMNNIKNNKLEYYDDEVGFLTIQSLQQLLEELNTGSVIIDNSANCCYRMKNNQLEIKDANSGWYNVGALPEEFFQHYF